MRGQREVVLIVSHGYLYYSWRETLRGWLARGRRGSVGRLEGGWRRGTARIPGGQAVRMLDADDLVRAAEMTRIVEERVRPGNRILGRCSLRRFRRHFES